MTEFDLSESDGLMYYQWTVHEVFNNLKKMMPVRKRFVSKKET